MVCHLEPKLEPEYWNDEENQEDFYDVDEEGLYLDWLEMLEKQRNKG